MLAYTIYDAYMMLASIYIIWYAYMMQAYNINYYWCLHDVYMTQALIVCAIWCTHTMRCLIIPLREECPKHNVLSTQQQNQETFPGIIFGTTRPNLFWKSRKSRWISLMNQAIFQHCWLLLLVKRHGGFPCGQVLVNERGERYHVNKLV